MEIHKIETSVLKAWAIIFVVISHIVNIYFKGDLSFTGLLGTGGVAVFLFLSGYGLYVSYEDKGLSKNFWNNKIQNIFLPYWLVTCIYYLIFIQEKSAVVLMKNLFCIDYERKIDGTMWYMSFLIIWYLLFYFLYSFEIHNIVRIFILFLFAYCLREKADLFKACGWQFSNNFLSFPIGVSFAFISKRLRLNALTWTASILLTLTALIYVCLINKASYQQTGILIIMILVLVVYIKRKLNFQCRIFMIIGNCSYLIYLIEGKIFDILPKTTYPSFNTIIYLICLSTLTFIIIYIKRVKIPLILKK